MLNNKDILEQMLEIGGIATLNNFYSPEAKTYLGSLYNIRKKFKLFLEYELIKEIPTIGKTRFPANEVFYSITKKGANYIGRQDYIYKGYPKSPNNIMHESMKFDIALAFLRLYPKVLMSFRYDYSFYGLRPDIVIKIEGKITKYFLVEIERKKTIDRVFKEKIKRYEDMFYKMQKNKSHNISQFTVLFVYTNIWFNVFLRPQQYESYTDEIAFLHEKTKELAKLAKNLPHNYLFMPFSDFYKLNESVWYNTGCNKTALVL